jgi:hypothetical protein
MEQLCQVPINQALWGEFLVVTGMNEKGRRGGLQQGN